MNRRIFNQDQIDLIKQNPWVHECSDKIIKHTKEFKLKALKQYEEGITPTEIFREAGFDMQIIGKNVPKESIRRWRKTRVTKGKIGRPKKTWDTVSERIQYLEAQVAYLKAENDFLAKLRAKKTE